jgi:glycosyltransferase involved in cell wall biosynthesis
MKILHIQTGISNSGNSIWRLHKLMLQHGLDSNILCAVSNIKNDRIFAFPRWRIKYFALLNILSKLILRGKNNYNFSYPVFGHNLINHSLLKSADVIYLHWTQGGLLSMHGIRKILKTGKPIILSLRDFWYMTGGCHHPVNCSKFENLCNNCPNLNMNKEKDLSYKLFVKKMRLYKQFDNITVFVSSNWMMTHVKKSALLSNKFSFCIPNVLDKSVFRKSDMIESRLFFNLPSTKLLILFGSVRPTSNKNKGWDYLCESLSLLKNKSTNEFDLVVFGTGHDETIQSQLPFKIHFLGRITDEEKLGKIYSSCNVYVTPSLSEPFGNTILESLSCGTPVVSFNIGGATDMIDHKKNGYLADYKNSIDFASGIEYCLENNLIGYLKPEIEPEFSIQRHISELNNLLKK